MNNVNNNGVSALPAYRIKVKEIPKIHLIAPVVTVCYYL